MARVIWDVSMSLDGFTTGPNVRPEAPMGDGGEALHSWMAGKGPGGATDRAVLDAVNADLGATIIGRHTFDLALAIWGGTPWAGIDCFVITNRPRSALAGDNGGTFFFGSLEQAARGARDMAGEGNINILGASVARQLLRAGQVDLIRLHIVPILLGGGTPAFAGERVTLVAEGPPASGSVIHQLLRVEHARAR